MAKVNDEVIEQIEILAKLSLSDEEKEQTKSEMNRMLAFMETLNEVDTADIAPMTHLEEINVFREDVITNGDGSQETLANAPKEKQGMFKVPKTIGS